MALTKEEELEHRRESSKRWRASHPEYERVYCAANHDKIAGRQRAYKAAHHEKQLQQMREYRTAHRRERMAYSKEYDLLHRERRHARYAENRDKIKEQVRVWQGEHSELWKEIRRNFSKLRRARKRGVACEPIKLDEIFERDGWHCRLCGCETLKVWELGNIWAPELDHIIPLAGGGSHTTDNVQLLCHRCNVMKRDKMPEKSAQE